MFDTSVATRTLDSTLYKTAFYTRYRSKSCRAIAWMQHYFQQTGDQMPNRMVIHLPSFLNTLLVYNRMKEELEEREEEVIRDA